MSKTLHVVPQNGHWTIQREGRDSSRPFSTQREAIAQAKAIVHREGAGQLVVHGRDGRIVQHHTYGMPPIQVPPGPKSSIIEKAVSKITRDRLYGGGPMPTRG